MRQAVIPRYGGPEVFEVREAPDPVPGPGEVRIAVRAAGVNFADVLGRMGLYPDAPKPPMVMGYEVAGLVDAVGPDVSRVVTGDRVVALTRFGGYADRVVVPADFVFDASTDASDAELAALPVNYLTAMVALYRMANVQAGEHVLVLGAGGGVGLAATALAHLRRAVIIGVASAAKHDTLRQMGVDLLIDSRADIRAETLRFTGGRGVDVVLNPVGGASLASSYRLLAPLGRLVIYRHVGDGEFGTATVVVCHDDAAPHAAFSSRVAHERQPRRLRAEPRTPVDRAAATGDGDGTPDGGTPLGSHQAHGGEDLPARPRRRCAPLPAVAEQHRESRAGGT